MSIEIKICGITQPEDAALAAELGAHYIGMIFYEKSPRYIDTKQAKTICEALPDTIKKVGVFVNPSLEFIESVIKTVPIDLLQMHGHETEDFCQSLPLPYLKAIQIKSATELNTNPWFNSNAEAVLVDTHSDKAFGGTGETFDWTGKPEQLTKPTFLAGGLNPNNVIDAIKTFKPDAVDINSGVEYEPGKKDPALLKELFNQLETLL